MDLKVPITMTDELSDELIHSTGFLDLASGDISRITYRDYDVTTMGLPVDRDDYEFTSGTLSNNGKDVEFGVQVNKTTGQYSVTPNELLEIKTRAASLFAGLSGKDLLASVEAKAGRANKH